MLGKRISCSTDFERPYQFTLRALLLTVVAVAVLCGAVVTYTACRREPMYPEKPDPAMYSLPDSKRVARLAAAHLASHGMEWGNPMEMHENEEGSAYIVTYATPRGEIALLGARGVVVYIETGKVDFIPRE